MQIIIFHEKHGDRYFVSNSKEDTRAIALKIVLERYKEGYWYFFDSKKPVEPKISRLDGSKFGGTLSTAVEREWRNYEYDLNQYNQEQMDKQTLEVIKTKKDGKLAYKFLQERQGSEYEGFDVEFPEDF